MSTLEQHPAERPSSAPSTELKVSVVIACLNEAENIAECVRRAFAVIEAASLDGEVVVADNNSTDGSGDIAAAAGARVVREARSGPAAPIWAASPSSQRVHRDGGRRPHVPLPEIPRYVEELDKGAQLVMAAHMDNIHRGAIPWLRRYRATRC